MTDVKNSLPTLFLVFQLLTYKLTHVVWTGTWKGDKTAQRQGGISETRRDLTIWRVVITEIVIEKKGPQKRITRFYNFMTQNQQRRQTCVK